MISLYDTKNRNQVLNAFDAMHFNIYKFMKKPTLSMKLNFVSIIRFGLDPFLLTMTFVNLSNGFINSSSGTTSI